MDSAKQKCAVYSGLNGLRAYACIGIVLMHVLSNGGYEIEGFLFREVIPSLTDLVFLFMIISGFSMCCGYFDKIISNQISMEEFYSKRYAKVWPFFVCLCMLDLLVAPSWRSLYEVIANVTLCFGLLPNADIEVIGVGWFLGLVFVFYFIFPFYCFLLSDKRRAWLSFFVSVVFNYLCLVRFDTGRTNIIYCAPYFLAGGLIFLYRDALSKFIVKYSSLTLLSAVAMAFVYFFVSKSTVVRLLLFSLLLVHALRQDGYGILCNSAVAFLSQISMEVYLCHMVIFRVIEKAGLLRLFDSEALSYTVASVMTIAGAIIFSVLAQKVLGRIVGIRRHYQKTLT